MAATEEFVIVTSRDKSDASDLYVCLDSETGLKLWELTISCKGELDYGNSPRATPIITEDRAILLSAFGELRCVDIETGETVWSKHLIDDLGGALPIWGFCPSPILHDGLIFVQPGSAEASIAAIKLEDGEVAWSQPGEKAAYSSPMIIDTPKGKQLVTYDINSFNGYDPATGKVLWEHKPKLNGDFNVPTPVAVDGGLILMSENNATRIHRFDNQGKLENKPTAENLDLNSDSHSPVLVGNNLVGLNGKLYVLNIKDSLKQLSVVDEDDFGIYCSAIACEDRVLVVGNEGVLFFYQISGKGAELLGRMATQPPKSQVLSHPAMVGHVLFLRGPDGIDAWEFDE